MIFCYLISWQNLQFIVCYDSLLPRKTEVQEGGGDEHQQAQPRGAREEDCHQADQHGEESED